MKATSEKAIPKARQKEMKKLLINSNSVSPSKANARLTATNKIKENMNRINLHLKSARLSFFILSIHMIRKQSKNKMEKIK